MNISIRPATQEDCPLIRGIQVELNRPPRADLRAAEFLIALCDGTGVACAGTARNQEGAYFYGLAVRRSCQKKGIGSALMAARLDSLSGSHLKYAFALVMFWNSRFFRKFGFAPVKRRDLPASALTNSDLANVGFKRSSVMFRALD